MDRVSGFTLRVLNGIAAIAARGEPITVRAVCTEIGYRSTRRVYVAMQALTKIGILVKEGTRTRLKEEFVNAPVRVPIIGYLNSAADFVPGSRWIEIREGQLVVVK